MRFRWMVVAVAVLACGCSGEVAAPGAHVGQAAPAYAASTQQGARVALADLRGQVVLLNVWATWCPPCRQEMPGLQSLQAELGGRGLRVVGVSVDGRGAEGDVAAFVAEQKVRFTILLDPDEGVARTFGTTGVPETFLIGRDGRLLSHWIGRIDPHSPGVWNAVGDALKAPAPAA